MRVIVALCVLVSLVCCPFCNGQNDGELDTTFGTSGVATFAFEDTRAVAYDIKQQADGKLVLGGYCGMGTYDLGTLRFTEGGYAKFAVARLNLDGTLDTTFGTDGMTSVAFGDQDAAVITRIGIMDDGRIQAVGFIYKWAQGNYVLMARFTTDGVLDTTYGEGGLVGYGFVGGCPFDSKAFDAVIYGDGRVMLAGRGAPNGGYVGLLARFDSDGVMQSNWGSSGSGWTSLGLKDGDGTALDTTFLCVYEYADGRILCGGKVATMPNVSGPADVLVARFTSAGVLDTTFGEGNGYVNHTIASNVSDTAYALTTDTNGNIFVAGEFDQDEAGILALDDSGELLSLFGTNGVTMLPEQGAYCEGMLDAIRVVDDGKIIVSGAGKASTGTHRYLFARFTPGGALDTTFGDGSGETLVALSVLQDDDGQAMLLSSIDNCVYVAGMAAGARRFGVARFHQQAPTPTPIGGELVPVYRLYSYGSAESTYEHLWTINEAEKDTLDSWPSWEYEGIAWYAYTNQVADSLPLYRLYAASVKQHHYTIDAGEYASLDGNGTWVGEGVQYYVYATPAISGAMPAYRFYHAGLALHHFTIDVDEKDSIVANTNWGYIYEGVGYYVCQTNSSSLTSVNTVSEPKSTPISWVTSKAEAMATGLSQGKIVLMVSGRESCGLCYYMRYTVCESTSPAVRSLIDQSFVPWFCDMETSSEWNTYSSGLGYFSLPLICCISPDNPDTYLDRSTGTQTSQEFYDRLTAINAAHGNLPAAPTGVSATDGAYTNKVQIIWAGSTDATGYELWRNSKDDSASASRLAHGLGAIYDDTNVVVSTVYYYWVKATNSAGVSGFSSSDSGYSQTGTPSLTAVYRLYSYGSEESTYEHLWTTSESEKDTLDSWPSWQYEGVAWYAYSSESSGTVPLLRLYAASVKQHHYTIDSAEYVALAGNGTWNGEGVQYFVNAAQVTNTVPVYRFYHAGSYLHHFTIDEGEKTAIEDNPAWGYVYEGIGFYVYATNTVSLKVRFEGSMFNVQPSRLKSRRKAQNLQKKEQYSRCYEPADGHRQESEDLYTLSSDVIPVPGDYDGDGIEEMAYYYETTGIWRILSGAERFDISDLISEIVPLAQWGGPGFVPVAGDYDGDGCSDLAVYCETSGCWYVRKVDPELILWDAVWGGPGMQPVAMDADQDGVSDLAVIDDATEMLFILSVDGRLLFWDSMEQE